MRLPHNVAERFRRYGRQGGLTRARNLPARDRKSIARIAVLRRWIEFRFGSPSFAALGLPGGAMIDAGLKDLAAGKETVESLAVSLAAPRLRREGIPLPTVLLPDADRRLYRLLESSNEQLAHARYHACLRQLASFADACPVARIARGSSAR